MKTATVPLRIKGPMMAVAIAFGLFNAFAPTARAVVIGFETTEGYSTTGGTTFANGNLGGQGISPNTWSSPTTTGADKLRVVSNSFSSGNSSSQVVELFDTIRAQNDLYRIFNPSIGSTFNSSSTVLSFGFQYLYDGIASTSASSLRYGIGEMGSGQQILRIELVSNGKLNFNDGTNYITVKNAQGSDLVSSLDQWITISGIADYSTNTYTLFVNGVQQVGSAGTGDFNMNFFSTANKTSVLNFFAMGSTGATYAPIYLDNVSLQAVPEPATAMLVGLACGAVLLSRRRRS